MPSKKGLSQPKSKGKGTPKPKPSPKPNPKPSPKPKPSGKGGKALPSENTPPAPVSGKGDGKKGKALPKKKPAPAKSTGGKRKNVPKPKPSPKKKDHDNDDEEPMPEDNSQDSGNDSDHISVDDSGDGSSDEASDHSVPIPKGNGNKKPKFPTTILTRCETVMDWKYSGGTNLSQFQREFKSTSYLNDWAEDMAVHKLRSLLSGTARTFVDGLIEDYGGLVEIDDVFKQLEMEFVTPSAKAMAKAKVEGLKRRDGESAVEFGARWMRAWKAAGQKNDESAAIKFFKSCSSQGYGEGLVYSRSLHKSVNAVAEALEGLEMTEIWRGRKLAKRKRAMDDLVSDESDAASSGDEPQRGRRGGKAKRSEEPTLSINQLEIMALAAVEKAASGHVSKIREPSPKPVPGHLQCQLCNKPGHTASSCTEIPHCSKCLLNGHIAACCPHTNGECFGCGQMGHLLTHCPMRRGRGNLHHRGRGRGRGPPDDPPRFSGPFNGACYNCGRVGHSARYCQSTPTSNPVKREPQTPSFSAEQLAAITESLSQAAAQRSSKTQERDAGAGAAPKSEK